MGGSGMACWRRWEACSIGRDSLVMAVRCMGQVGMVRHYQLGPLVVLCTLSPWCEGFSLADLSSTVNVLLHFGCIVALADEVTLQLRRSLLEVIF